MAEKLSIKEEAKLIDDFKNNLEKDDSLNAIINDKGGFTDSMVSSIKSALKFICFDIQMTHSCWHSKDGNIEADISFNYDANRLVSISLAKVY